MNLVTLNKISHQYSERPLFTDLSFLINEGDRIGLIGPNGAGKTTLLRLIAGLEKANEGERTVWGGVEIRYLAQNPDLDPSLSVLDTIFSGNASQIQLLRRYQTVSDQLQKEPLNPQLQEQLSQLSNELTRTDSWKAETEAKSILSRLGITDFQAKIETLSGGQKKRVALANALLDPRDLLILDEPTNHIDAETIAWLEKYLLNLNASLLLVTHDRYFLDRVANRIVELNQQKLRSYAGNYSRYLTLATEREDLLAANQHKREALLKRELAWLQRGAQARSTKQKARIQRAEQLQETAASAPLENDRIALSLASRRLGKRVLEAKNISHQFDDQPLFSGIDFHLDPGDRIGIVGPNGVGKTTFLDILAGQLTAQSAEINWGETVVLGYYDQHSRLLDPNKKLFDFIAEQTAVIETADQQKIDAAQMLEWFLFPRPQQQAYIHSLSGGEKRRLYLLYILAQQPNVLILDEPTNDLDIQTLTVLEQFLDQFQGSLIVISHDRYFLDRTVDFLSTFVDQKLSGRYPTPFDEYLLTREKETAALKIDSPSAQKESTPSPKKETTRKLSWKEKKELASLDTQLIQLEAKKEKIQTEINQIGDAYQELASLAQQLEETETKLEQIMERWFVLSEINEG